MEETFVPFEGIKNDLRGRLMCYKQDWTGGIKAGVRYILINHIYYIVFFFFYRIYYIAISGN